MKKILICGFVLVGVLGYSQQKKKTYKKKSVKKITKIVKKTAEPTVTTSYKDVEEEKKEIIPVVSESKKEEIQKEENFTQKIIQKLSQRNGWIKNRNFISVRGVEAFIKGIYVHKDKIFIMVDVYNRTNIDYDIESVSFITSPVNNKTKHIMQEEKIYIPVDDNQPEKFIKKSKHKLIYAFDKFTISDNTNLMILIDEQNGDRSISLPIKASYFTNSEYIHIK